MKYNKSEIMKRANVIFAEGGFTWSMSLKRSWAEAKKNILENRVFAINMMDLQSNDDKQLRNALQAQIRQLNNFLNPPAKTKFVKLTAQEYAVVKAEFEKLYSRFEFLNDEDYYKMQRLGSYMEQGKPAGMVITQANLQKAG